MHRDASFVLDLPYDPERLCVPDVAYVERMRMEAIPDPERLLRCAPDLAIEIDITFIESLNRPGLVRKPGGRRRIAEYLEAGTRLVWAIDSHTRTAMVHRANSPKRFVRENET